MTSTLPLLIPLPRDAVTIDERFAIVSEGDLRVVLFYGHPLMDLHVDDTAARDLVMVSLCEHGGLTEDQVARAFEVSRPTVSRAKKKYAQGGTSALVPEKRGPRGASKINDYKAKLMVALARAGKRKTEIATRLGVNESAVRKALRRMGLEKLAVQQPQLVLESESSFREGTDTQGSEALQPTVEAAVTEENKSQGETEASEREEVELPAAISMDQAADDRSMDRALARMGVLDDAAPLFETRRDVRNAGLLLAVPILVMHGVIADAVRIFGSIGPAFYGIRNTVVSLLLLFLARINRPEQLKEHSPQELGVVLGLDRAPEMKTVRRKLRRLSGLKKSLELMMQLTKRHLARNGSTKLWLYVDGHVSVYSGKRLLNKHHVTRLRVSLPSVLDYWVNDERGDPVVAVTGEPKKGMTKLVPRLIEELRERGEMRPLTVIFDREGWSPQVFARLAAMEGVFFMTYRKANPNEQLPQLAESMFRPCRGEIDDREVEYRLANNGIYVEYGSGRKKRRLHLRQITCLRDTGEQTHVVTNDWTGPELLLAHRMFGRWTQENFFKYMGQEMDFDALLTYAMEDADGDREVTNPERRRLAQKLHELKARLAELTREYGERALDNQEKHHRTMRGFKIANRDLGRSMREVTAEFEQLKTEYDSLPLKVPVRQILNGKEPQQVRVETRRLISCFRIAVFRAESALRELLRPHYRRWRQDGRTIVQSMLQSSGDLEVHPGELRVILTPQSAPHRTKALAMLCDELNTLRTRFPGSDLRLRFFVRDYGNVS